jgi:hypothetical protein
MLYSTGLSASGITPLTPSNAWNLCAHAARTGILASVRTFTPQMASVAWSHRRRLPIERDVDEPDGVPAEERRFLPLLFGLGALLECLLLEGLQDLDDLPCGLCKVYFLGWCLGIG